MVAFARLATARRKLPQETQLTTSVTIPSPLPVSRMGALQLCALYRRYFYRLSSHLFTLGF